jgi:hypothetical protein
MRGCGEGGGERREGFEVAEVVCECLLGEEDLSDCGGDFAVAHSPSIITMPYRHRNAHIAMILSI